MNLTLVTEITDSMIDKAFEKITKIHWGGWTNEDFLLGLGNVGWTPPSVRHVVFLGYVTTRL